MRRLEHATGQQRIVERVLESQQVPGKSVVTITGPVGCGKSWVIERIGRRWEAQGGKALYARGDASTPQRKLFPWLTLASPTSTTLARWDVLKESLTQASKSVPVVGAVTSYLVDELLNYRKKQLSNTTSILGEKEQDLMYVIQTASKGKRLCLAIDDVEIWDEDSWALLNLILSRHLDESYPVLKDATIVIVAEPDTLPRIQSSTGIHGTFGFTIKRLEKEDMPLALSAFAFPPGSDKYREDLYNITTGKLDLLHDLSVYLQGSEMPSFRESYEALFSTLIQRRFRNLKDGLKELEELLSAASFLGASFSFEDILCLTGKDKAAIQPVIHLAEIEKFLSKIGDRLSFPNVALRNYFHATSKNQHIHYHEKFADCLRLMRPSDYEARWQHLMLAEQFDEAMTCYALAALESRRQLKSPPDPGRLTEIAGWEDVEMYLGKMSLAYKAYEESRVADGIAVLEEIESFLADPLIAERDYLTAQIRLKLHRVTEFERAVLLLERWQGLRDSEPELWSRIAQVLFVSLAETNRPDAAFQLEEAVTRHFWNRRKVDPWAIYGLNCLRKRAECVHHLPVAQNRLRNASDYFGSSDVEALPRHPLQYYYTLNNLVANLLVSGSFDEASQFASLLERTIQEHHAIPWPSLEVPANNYVLTGFLKEALTIENAVSLMQQIIVDQTDIGDSILLRNNYAVLLVHAGRVSEARAILEELQREIAQGDESDTYHRYFVGNNLAGLQISAGELPQAVRLLDDISRGLDRLYPAIRLTMKRRHEILRERLIVPEKMETIEFDKLFTKVLPQLGPQWSFYGRGFLFSDIQFWSVD